MTYQSKTKARLHAINVLQQRNSRSKLWGLGVFLTMSVAMGVSSILVGNVIKFSKANILLSSKQPLLVPILVNGVLLSLYLALLASAGISKEYDKGTLETLMVGPVDEITFVMGNFLAHLKVFGLTLLAALGWSYLCIWLLNFSPRPDIIALLFANLFMASELIAFGVLTAVWGGKTKNALIYFILIILFLSGIQLANSVVASVAQIENAHVGNSLILVRNVLTTTNRFIQWISPYSQVRYAMQSILDQRYFAYLLSMGLMVLQTALLLIGSVLSLKKKGVRGIV